MTSARAVAGSPVDARSVAAWRAHGAEFDDPSSLRRRLRAGTLPAIIAGHAAERAAAAALTVADDRVTYGELDDRVVHVAAWLSDRGVGRGDRVAVVGPDTVDLVAVCLAVMRIGAVTVVVSPRLTAPELQAILTPSRPVAVVADGRVAEVVSRAADAVGTARHHAAMGPEPTGGIPHVRALPPSEDGFIATNPLDGPRVPGSVGRAFPGVEVRVTDDDGHDVADGQEGEIVVRSSSLCAGYLDGDPLYHAGGWYRTGDIGVFDPPSGYLRVTGRSSDVIITGGVNVSPREVELELERLPGIKRAAVLGAPSDEWGEEVVALLVTDEQAPDSAVGRMAARDDDGRAAVAQALRRRLAGPKIPRRVRFVDTLPVTDVGKVQRRRLPDLWRRAADAGSGSAADATDACPSEPDGTGATDD